MHPTFTENQKFAHLWLLAIALFGFIPLYYIWDQLFIKNDFGDKPLSDAGLIVLALVNISVLALVASIKLTTEIDAQEIRVRVFPFVKKTFLWSDIKKAEVLNYGFVGGWGIRLWTKYGTVYNVKGNRGLAIELVNGKKYLIGTQKEKALAELVERYANN